MSTDEIVAQIQADGGATCSDGKHEEEEEEEDDDDFDLIFLLSLIMLYTYAYTRKQLFGW